VEAASRRAEEIRKQAHADAEALLQKKRDWTSWLEGKNLPATLSLRLRSIC